MGEPVRYPDLSSAKLISLDSETKDPNLTTMGPGMYRKDGYILGVSLSDGEGFSEYYNLGHYDCGRQEREKNVRYLTDVLALPAPKIGQNISYDVDWLENGEYSIPVNGELGGVDTAEALLDETQLEYNLDFMGKKYLGIGKEKTEIDIFCEQNNLKGDSRKWLWKMPYELVRKYARQDAYLPARIFAIQQPMLEEQELMNVYHLECRLNRVLIEMRKTGIRIDTNRRDRNGLAAQNEIEEMEQELFSHYGEFNYNSAYQLAPILKREGFEVPTTAPKLKKDGTFTKGGNPSVNAYFFKRYADENETIKKIAELRKARHILDTFIMGSHREFVCPDGLIHAQFFGLKNDSLGALKGTRSGRLSGANPNLQQQPSPSRDKKWGTKCREDFIPFDDCWWGKIDYEQIEYRFMAHFAVGEGSDLLRQSYLDNPYIDYHQFIVDLTGLPRPLAKNLNFGIAFGMGAPHMAEYFGWDIDYAREILALYHQKAPYVKATMSLVEKRAVQRGYIKTFLKRRSRLIDPKKAYTMYCRLVQGSAADLTKSAMVQAYDAGIFNTLALHATVHDELDVSIPKTKVGVEAFQELHHIMESALTIRVPILAEPEIGPNWADLKTFEWPDLYKEVS